MTTETTNAEGVAMLWYYTTAKELNDILGAGELRPEAIAREKAAVWFSTNQDWEPIANMPRRESAGRLSKDQTYVLGGGLARIGVDLATAPHDWKAFKQLSGIAPKTAKEVYNAAVQAGSRPGHWHASFEAVARSKWLAIEILDGEVWVARPQ